MQPIKEPLDRPHSHLYVRVAHMSRRLGGPLCVTLDLNLCRPIRRSMPKAMISNLLEPEDMEPDEDRCQTTNDLP